jgi:hypothetical protein
MPQFALLGAALLAWIASAGFTARTSNVYLPKKALQCERAVRRQSPTKYCKDCNTKATIGASDSVAIQIGGCARSGSQLATVAEFTYTGIFFSAGIEAPSFNVDTF